MTGQEVPACQNGVKLAILPVVTDKKEWVPMISGKDGYKPVAFFLRVPPASLGAVANYGKTVAGMGKITIPWTGPMAAAVKGIVHVPAVTTSRSGRCRRRMVRKA